MFVWWLAGGASEGRCRRNGLVSLIPRRAASFWLARRARQGESVQGRWSVWPWCERRDSNPHGGYPLEPKSSASTNSATFAVPQILARVFYPPDKEKRPAVRPGVSGLVVRQGFEPWTY